ncbi:hypothetical protein Tco_0528292 [Tanacetum coccineum]
MLQELKTLFAQQAEQELLQTTQEFHSCKQEEKQSVSSYVLKMKGYIDNLERLGHPVSLGFVVSLILISQRKEFDGFVQNYNMHNMGKTINELYAMIKLHEKTLPRNNALALHAIRADNATYSASAEDIAVQFCFFDIQLTSLSPRNWYPPECFFRVIKASRHDQIFRPCADCNILQINRTEENSNPFPCEEALRDVFNRRALLSLWCESELHAVATASAQNDNGSLEAESIVRAASTRVRFRLSTTPFYSGKPFTTSFFESKGYVIEVKMKQPSDAIYHALVEKALAQEQIESLMKLFFLKIY